MPDWSRRHRPWLPPRSIPVVSQFGHRSYTPRRPRSPHSARPCCGSPRRRWRLLRLTRPAMPSRRNRYTPTQNGAVALQRQTVVASSGDGYHIGKPGRCCCLAVAIITPSDAGSVALQRQTVVVTRGDGHHVGKSGRYRCLSKTIKTPANDSAVALQCQTVEATSGDGHHIGKPSRYYCFSVVIIPPADDGAVALQGEAVVITGGDRYYVGQRRGR